MELGHDFSLNYAFHWDEPISAVQQESIASYGNDEDRVRLAGHPSVSPLTLEALAQALSPEVRLAAAQNRLTPLESLARLYRDHDRVVKAAATEAIAELPELQRAQVRGMVESPIQRLRARLSA